MERETEAGGGGLGGENPGILALSSKWKGSAELRNLQKGLWGLDDAWLCAGPHGCSPRTAPGSSLKVQVGLGPYVRCCPSPPPPLPVLIPW